MTERGMNTQGAKGNIAAWCKNLMSFLLTLSFVLANFSREQGQEPYVNELFLDCAHQTAAGSVGWWNDAAQNGVNEDYKLLP